MDSKFQESRDAMRAERFSSSKDHFVAGVKGLGMGLVGGLTSIVTQPMEGAHNAGLSVSFTFTCLTRVPVDQFTIREQIVR